MRITSIKTNQRGLAPLFIVLIVVAVLAVGGVGYYVYQQSQNNETETVTVETTEGTADIDVLVGDNAPFVATVSGTRDGQTYNATLESNGEGVTQFTSTVDGQQIRAIYTKDAFYSCTGDQCYVMPLDGATQQSFDPSQYEYTAEDVAAWKSTSTYAGQQSCAGGTCDVWQVNDSTDGTTSKIFINTSTRRIAQVEVTTPEGTSSITYEYKPVTIAIPTNAQQLN
ncbi:hypothetical protein KC951_01215 [Candidatus Saccharibacteria bacterium]|nr:hypothetical protein [Candidatus Saccharibacteria bacterium]